MLAKERKPLHYLDPTRLHFFQASTYAIRQLKIALAQQPMWPEMECPVLLSHPNFLSSRDHTYAIVTGWGRGQALQESEGEGKGLQGLGDGEGGARAVEILGNGKWSTGCLRVCKPWGKGSCVCTRSPSASAT